MDPTTPATSIFEFLTTENPKVLHPKPKSKSLTSSPKFYYPTQLKPWDEFTFETLETIYDGILIHEARRTDRALPAYPTILPKYDCVVIDERTTTTLIDKWNEAIVRTALIPVQHTLHPSIWASGFRQNGKEHDKREVELALSRRAKRRQPPRAKAYRVNKPKKTTPSRLRPDSGAVSHDVSLGSDSSPKERFPKEYKTASKWQSEVISQGHMINGKGEWRDGSLNKKNAMPIRQAYTYCVTHGCRYGCILTCAEAFIFRVKPRARSLDNTSGNTEDSITDRLIQDGLMEYVSIPWANHRNGNLDGFRSLTVNLALWFVHILAGNQHEVDWNYGPLSAERLAIQRSQLSNDASPGIAGVEDDHYESDDSQKTVLSEMSPLSETHKGILEEDDPIHFSFSESQSLVPQSV